MIHDFELADYEIETIGSSNDLDKIKSAIKKYWMAPTREKIEKIREATEFEGQVFAVEMNNASPPLLGSYVQSLLFEGWGIIHYDDSTMYLGKIQYDIKNDNFYFKGRRSLTQTNDLSIMNKDISIEEKSDNTDLYQLLSTVTQSWDEDCIDIVSEIKTATNEDTYIIETKTNTSYIDENDKHCQIYPSTPTGKSIDSLLYHGWVVSAVKQNMIFVSKINYIISEDVMFSTESSDRSDEFTYKPRECEVCGTHEFQDTYITGVEEPKIVDDKLPVYTSVCYSCYEESPSDYMDREEFEEKHVDSEA